MTAAPPVHFKKASEFQRWLKAHHDSAVELLVGFHTKQSGEGGVTYAEALDEALCFGWIDGVRRNVDSARYSVRFSPRRPRSAWSLVNVGHVKRLIREGRMEDAGLKAYNARKKERTGIYSFENRPEKLPKRLENEFRSNSAAWAHWTSQPPGYRRTATWWVVSAVREETRARRLAALVEASGSGRRIGLLV